MSEINDGGSAFPTTETNRFGDEITKHIGLSMRDYFAATELGKTSGTSICDHPSLYARLADHCYRMADAMIAERAK